MTNNKSIIIYFLISMILLSCVTILLLAKGMDGIFIANLITTINVILISVLIWWRTNFGQSYLFLFISTFVLFLCGRFISALFGYDVNSGYISFGGFTKVGVDNYIYYSLIVNVSLFGLVTGLFFEKNTIQFCSETSSTNNESVKNFLKFIFIVTVPLYFYKNYSYMNYIFENGGYLAIYKSTEHIKSVGLLARIGSMICLSAAVMVLIYTQKKEEFKLNFLIFCIFFSFELIIGLRGKYFTLILSLYFLYCIRFGLSFNVLKILMIGCGIVLLSLFVEVFRENKEEASVIGNLLLGFLHQQSISSEVVQGIVKFEDKIPGSGIDYLFKQFLIPFIHPTEVGDGWFLTDDFSRFIMPIAYSNGFGTGSSYLAELYLIGGLPLIFFGNFLLSMYLLNLKVHNNLYGVAKFWMIVGLVYYPRTTLQDPIHNLMKYFIVSFLLILIYELLKGVKNHESSNK